MKAFLRFSRPHTIIGTTLSVSALYIIAAAENMTFEFPPLLWLLTLISCLGANIFIVGLNQITDVAIDRINKPYLPLASGVYSMQTARGIIAASVFISLLIAFSMGRFLAWTVVLSLLLGIAYSLPPVRLKRFHFWAAFCIIAVRGLIVNILLYLHFTSHINGVTIVPTSVWLLTFVIFMYSIVIAWFKDTPDLEGDRTYGIRTLSLRLGVRQVLRSGNIILGITLAAVFFICSAYETGLSRPLMIYIHIFIACTLALALRFVRMDDRLSLFRYYQTIWLVFFIEYIAFATAALMA